MLVSSVVTGRPLARQSKGCRGGEGQPGYWGLCIWMVNLTDFITSLYQLTCVVQCQVLHILSFQLNRVQVLM